jgi:hypothetical protein
MPFQLLRQHCPCKAAFKTKFVRNFSRKGKHFFLDKCHLEAECDISITRTRTEILKSG